MLSDVDSPLPVFLAMGFVTQAAAYFAVVGTAYLVFWRLLRTRIPRIQATRRFDRKQLFHELKYTAVTLVVGTTSAGGVLLLHATHSSKIVTTPVSVAETVAWVLGLVVFNDLWFYGWHRLLHTPVMFRRVHAVHHKSVDVNPFTSYSFHAFEGFILGVWILPVALLLPLPTSALGAVQVIGLANNVMSHLGVELLPRWLMRVPLLRLTNTATFHSLHHTRLSGNFGLHTRVWDRFFGTELPEYEETFARRARPTTSAP